MSVTFDRVNRRNGEAVWHPLAWALVWLALIVAHPALTVAGEKRPKPRRIEGLATEVEAARVTIHTEKGEDITVVTKEDFRDKVAIGSKVKAWYYPGEGTNELKWLEYPLESSFVSPHQFLPQIEKIIVLPSSEAGDADPLFDALESYLQSKAGLFVAHRMLAEEIRRRTPKPGSTLDVIDPDTGNVDLAAYVEDHRQLIRKVTSETRVDALLEANVETVLVNFRSQMAVWDGVRQPVSSKVSRTLSFVAARPVDGYVPAATLALKLWDADGKLLWRNRRGFCVLALRVGVGNKFRDHTISEAVQDRASVEKWLGTVFGSWLPAPQAGQAEAEK